MTGERKASPARPRNSSAAPRDRGTAETTSGPGYQSVHLFCRTGCPVTVFAMTLGRAGRSYLGRLPRLVARGCPAAVSGPVVRVLSCTSDEPAWEEAAVIDS